MSTKGSYVFYAYEIILINDFRCPLVAIQKDNGTIYVGKCDCPAANCGKCVHIACLLYMVEEITHVDGKPRIDDPCTSRPCSWNTGSTRNIDPHGIGEVVILLETCGF